MDARKIVVVVEDVDAARTALVWALHNLLRHGDLITLLHLFSPCKSRSKKKIRLLRLKGYQLALSFKDICLNNFFNTNIEIIVAEDDLHGERIIGLVREIGASMLVVGVHQYSFLYRLALNHDNVAESFSCRVMAIKAPTEPRLRNRTTAIVTQGSLTNMDFSQIDVSTLELPEISPPKIPYKICPSPYAILFRSKKAKTKSRSSKIMS